MMFLLRCPKCKNTMKYATSSKTLEKKRKACVYCGAGFGVRKAIIKQLS